MRVRPAEHRPDATLGDVSGVIHDLVTFHPEMDVCYTYRFNGRAFTMDTRQFREVLGGVRWTRRRFRIISLHICVRISRKPTAALI